MGIVQASLYSTCMRELRMNATTPMLIRPEMVPIQGDISLVRSSRSAKTTICRISATAVSATRPPIAAKRRQELRAFPFRTSRFATTPQVLRIGTAPRFHVRRRTATVGS